MKKQRYLDYYILVPFLLLLLIGVVMVYSASAYWIKTQYGQAETAVLLKHSIFVVVGLVVALVCYHLRLRVFENWIVQTFLWSITLFLLIYLAVLSHVNPSAAVNGSTAWIKLGPINIQPSEIAKLMMILYLANIFRRRQKALVEDFSVKKFWGPGILVVGTIGLVFFQPDTGGAVILAGITFVMLIASGISLRYGLSWSALLLTLAGGGYYFLSHLHVPANVAKLPYQMRRLIAAVHPFAMRKLEGNQVVNSLVAIAHGGFFGVGLGNSSQKLGYLPEPYTDFILSIIAEELGVIGALVVVGLIFTLILRFYWLGVTADKHHTYQALISYGIATMLLIQTGFNVGAVLGLVPVTGVTLPFISYGGSSMLVLCASVGIMLNISSRQKAQNQKKVGVTHA